MVLLAQVEEPKASLSHERPSAKGRRKSKGRRKKKRTLHTIKQNASMRRVKEGEKPDSCLECPEERARAELENPYQF